MDHRFVADNLFFYFIFSLFLSKFLKQTFNLFFLCIWLLLCCLLFVLFKIICKNRFFFQFHPPLIFLLVRSNTYSFYYCLFCFGLFFNWIYFAISSIIVLFYFYIKYNSYFFIAICLVAYHFLLKLCSFNSITKQLFDWDFTDREFDFMIYLGLLSIG
jgi:hypothetical protein